MKYIVKQKLISMKPSYEVFYPSGTSLYKVKGSFGGRENFKLLDSKGETIATCGTKINFLSIIGSFLRLNFKKYHVHDGQTTFLSFSRSLNPFLIKYNLQSAIDNLHFGYGMSGSYQFKLGDKVLCDIDKKNLVIGTDEYHVEIADDQSQLGFLMSVIALDRIAYTRR